MSVNCVQGLLKPVLCFCYCSVDRRELITGLCQSIIEGIKAPYGYQVGCVGVNHYKLIPTDLMILYFFVPSFGHFCEPLADLVHIGTVEFSLADRKLHAELLTQ